MILETIKELLKLKKKTTYPEIASVSGRPKLKVIKEINANLKWLFVKDGQIIGLKNCDKLQRDEAFKEGRVFKTAGIYGDNRTEIIIHSDHKEKYAELFTDIKCGFIGDCWKKRVILDDPEVREHLKNEGFIEYSKYKTKPLEWLWVSV